MTCRGIHELDVMRYCAVATCAVEGGPNQVRADNHWEPPSGATCIWLCDKCIEEAVQIPGWGE